MSRAACPNGSRARWRAMGAPDAALIPAGLTRAQALVEGRVYLRQAGIEAAEEDARLLLLGACAIDRLALVTGADLPLTSDEATRYGAHLARRAAGEPASRILGRRPFWTLDLAVRPGVLDPRGDSEALVRLAARAGQAGVAPPRRILDLGCGSGALLCAALSEFPQASGIGVDISAEACAATLANIKGCGLSDRAGVIRGAWCEALAGEFDLILSNPPYIPAADISGLDREVRDHDPRLALDGGPDGLDAYRALFDTTQRVLAKGGVLALEYGFDQGALVERLAGEAGWRKIDAERDFSDHDRAGAFRPIG